MQPLRATLIAGLLGLAVLASPAQAADPTTTSVTTPADGSTSGPLAFDTGLNRYPMTISGTSDGTSGAVDLFCYYLNQTGAVTRQPLLTNVAVGADGTFTTAVADGRQLAFRPCSVLAVPTGTTPVDLSPFHGPRAHAVIYGPTAQSGGPNDGKVYDYYVAASGPRGYSDYKSTTSCGLDDMVPFGEVPAAAGTLQQTANRFPFYCNGWYYENQQYETGKYRSGIRLDGRDVYGAAAAQTINNDGAWIPVEYAPTFDASTGRTTIAETDRFVMCPANVDPAQVTSGNCASFSDAQFTDKRTQVVDASGRVVTQVDVFSSQNGARTVDILEEEDSQGSNNWFRFPGEGAFAQHTTLFGAVTLTDPGRPTSMLWAADASTPGSYTNTRGSTTFFPTPDKAIFISTSSDDYVGHYTFLVPASGTVTVSRIYTAALTDEELAPLTTHAEDSLTGPKVAITAPAADGTTVATPALTVSGTATDDVTVSGVTVNGVAVTLGSGTFTKDLTLNEGPNTIAVVASDGAGNTATATRSITYTKPLPPLPPPPPPVVKTRPAIGGVTIACPAGGATCSATTTWTSLVAVSAAKKKKHKLVVARRVLTIAPGKSAKVMVKLTKAGVRYLRKHRSIRVLRRISARAGTGTPVVKTAKVTIKRKKKG